MKMDYGFRFSFIVYNASFIKNKGKQLKYNKMTWKTWNNLMSSNLKILKIKYKWISINFFKKSHSFHCEIFKNKF
jgi:hypothetical protein